MVPSGAIPWSGREGEAALPESQQFLHLLFADRSSQRNLCAKMREAGVNFVYVINYENYRNCENFYDFHDD